MAPLAMVADAPKPQLVACRGCGQGLALRYPDGRLVLLSHELINEGELARARVYIICQVCRVRNRLPRTAAA